MTIDAFTGRALVVDDVIERAVSVEQHGGRMLAFYYCFGKYDGLIILEAPDDIAAAAGSVAGVSAGHLKVNQTTRLLTAEEGMEVMRRAGEVSFQRPT